MKNNKKVFLNLLLIVAISLSGCTQKQVVVQNPQVNSDSGIAYGESASEEVSKTIRPVSRIPSSDYSDSLEDLKSSGPETASLKSRLRENPNDLEARRELAEACFAKGAYITALEHYKELAVQLPDDSSIQLALAEVWRELKNYPSALRHVAKAIELDAGSVAAYSLLGKLYLDNSEYVKAERAFLAGLQLDSSNAELLSAVGRTLVELEQAHKAKGFLEGALALNPEMQEAREALAVVKVLLGDQQGGLEQLMLVYAPAEAYSKLGSICLEEERWTQAREFFLRALELEPNLGAAVWNLSVAESYISPPSVVAIPAFGGNTLQLAQEGVEPEAGTENSLAMNEDWRLPVKNSLHESIIDIPGFGSSAPRVAGLDAPSQPPDVLLDEGSGLWTDEVMALPRDLRAGEEFLVFQPEPKPLAIDASEESQQADLKVASLSQPPLTDQDHTVSLNGMRSQDYTILSEVYAVVTIPPFEAVEQEEKTSLEIALVDDQPILIVQSAVRLEAENSGVQPESSRESVQIYGAPMMSAPEIEPIRPTVVSWVPTVESKADPVSRVESPAPEAVRVAVTPKQLGLAPLELVQEIPQETAPLRTLYADESEHDGMTEARGIELEAMAELQEASAENMNIYRADPEPVDLNSSDRRVNLSANTPEAKPAFPAGPAIETLPAISYRADRAPGDENYSAALAISLDTDNFPDGGLLPEALDSDLNIVQLSKAVIPGVLVRQVVSRDDQEIAEALSLETSTNVVAAAPVSSQELSEETKPAQTEVAVIEEPAEAIETAVVETDTVASSEPLAAEDSATRESKLAGVAWAFLFAGLLSMFLAMAIRFSRRRTTQARTGEI
jgi:tetratricopeptide (TPR) repeat protein